MKPIHAAAVYCASSTLLDTIYVEQAAELGKLMAEHHIRLVYGGGMNGLMGAVADAVMSHQGYSIGVIPRFMVENGWLRPGLSQVIEVDTMSERKQVMAQRSDAAFVLPGSVGTFDEMMDILSLKKLGLYLNPVIVLNTNGFYNPLKELLRRSISERFMSDAYADICLFADTPAQAVRLALQTPPSDPDIRLKAVI